MRYVYVRGLNNFQSLLTPRKVPSVIHSCREDEGYKSPASSQRLWRCTSSGSENVVQTPTKRRRGQLTARSKVVSHWVGRGEGGYSG